MDKGENYILKDWYGPLNKDQKVSVKVTGHIAKISYVQHNLSGPTYHLDPAEPTWPVNWYFRHELIKI